MHSRAYRDILGGAVLTVGGLLYGIYAYTHYELGTMSAMDSGMFPMWVGYILAGLGALIIVMALVNKGEYAWPVIEWRTLATVLASVAIFAFCVRRTGVIPAIILQVIFVSFADNKLSMLKKVILACVLAFLAYLIFKVGLGLPIHLFDWQF
ncbi:MAG: tripartite tricarboxylate transporter TctB family protein [Rhizobiales bacterium]|nr:tripartite tricarboxylate transporter TctB family protein [Hyphomicrobiales bacterium]